MNTNGQNTLREMFQDPDAQVAMSLFRLNRNDADFLRFLMTSNPVLEGDRPLDRFIRGDIEAVRTAAKAADTQRAV